MKYFLAIVMCFTLFSCGKKIVDKSEPPITLSGGPVNKSASLNTPVPVENVTFKVIDSAGRLNPVVKNNLYQAFGDGEISVIGNGNKIKALQAGDLITVNSNYCNYADMFSLDDFKGKGDKYVGFLIKSFHPARTINLLGWMKINVNSDGSEIKIIEFMTNANNNQAIKVGVFN